MVEMNEMVDMIVKEVDPQGRILIPIQWRRRWKSRKLVLIRRGNRIELAPLDITPPSSLFDSIKISENVDFTDTHSVKKALLELQEH